MKNHQHQYKGRRVFDSRPTADLDVSQIQDPICRAILTELTPPPRYWRPIAQRLDQLRSWNVEVTTEVALAAARDFMAERGLTPGAEPVVIDRQPPLVIRRRQDVGVVYYLRFGEYCKIGVSGNLEKRLAAVPHDELLATEPGGRVVEQKRHRQFAALRHHKEWFIYADQLREHVMELRRVASGIR